MVFLNERQADYLRNITVIDKENALVYRDGKVMTETSYRKQIAHAKRKFG